MTKPTLNVPALRDLYAWVEKQDTLREQGLPNEWYQGDWYVDLDRRAAFQTEQFGLMPASLITGYTNSTCGTACCMAGHVVTAVLGHEPRVTPGGHAAYVMLRDADGDDRSIPDVAAEHLGLTDGQATELFSGNNTLDDVRRIMTAWGVL